jgi:myo-inositol 2-dehydrogenase / D-chiro-inositol 1-dehydrogenase
MHERPDGTGRLGVGFIGAGSVARTVHLPVLARLSHLYEVRHVMDVLPEAAETVAGRVGAKATLSQDELLADPAVDVVAICSPDQFHASQVVAACRAGKRAVLCEKPFTVSREEAAEVAAVSAETGVPILVGAMHTFDPGWLAATRLWGDLPESAHTIRSTIILPPNDRFIGYATELDAAGGFPDLDYEDAALVAALFTGGVLGLAIHDLPLVRRFLPSYDDLELLHAEFVRPFGYEIVLRAAGRKVELTGAMNIGWKPDWTFEVVSPESALTVRFTPSFVMGGSAVAEYARDGHRVVAGPYESNGYEDEWRRLAAIVAGTAEPPPIEPLIDDITFAVAIATAGREHLLGVSA